MATGILDQANDPLAPLAAIGGAAEIDRIA